MEIEEFLLARIAEDAAAARQEIADGYGGWQHESGWPSYRVLAECEAKREIVEWAEDNGIRGPHRVLHLLALPYADHPDYDPAWKP